MLIGQYVSNLSPKRRAAIPKSLREELGSSLIIAKWYEGCLVLVGQKNWRALLKRLTGKIRLITAPVRETDRFILGSAFELVPDGQGRVVIPKTLADYANLTKKVVFVGLGERVEIWSEAEWNVREEFVARHAGEFIEDLAEDEK